MDVEKPIIRKLQQKKGEDVKQDGARDDIDDLFNDMKRDEKTVEEQAIVNANSAKMKLFKAKPGQKIKLKNLKFSTSQLQKGSKSQVPNDPTTEEASGPERAEPVKQPLHQLFQNFKNTGSILANGARGKLSFPR